MSNSLNSIYITSQKLNLIFMNNSLLFNIDISRLNDGNSLEELTHSSEWHKTCYVLCNAGKTARAKKRKEKVSQELPHSPVQLAPTQHKHSLTFYENRFRR